MLQSLLALPLGVALEVLVFVLLYRLTAANASLSAMAVTVLSVGALFAWAAVNWPGVDVLAMYVAVLLVTAYLLWIVSRSREQKQEGEQAQRWFHWGPAIIVIFFLILFAVDSMLVVISKQGLPEPLARLLLPDTGPQNVSSAFPGTVANDFQKKEGDYNRYLQQMQKQKERGWQVSRGWLAPPVVGREQVFRVEVLDKQGAPLRSAQLSGVFQRPSDSRLDRSFSLTETAPGIYETRLALPAPGQWNLWLQIRRGEQLHEIHASTSVSGPPR